MNSQTAEQKQKINVETHCPECGSAWDIYKGAGICGYCGTEMPEPPAREFDPPKYKTPVNNPPPYTGRPVVYPQYYTTSGGNYLGPQVSGLISPEPDQRVRQLAERLSTLGDLAVDSDLQIIKEYAHMWEE